MCLIRQEDKSDAVCKALVGSFDDDTRGGRLFLRLVA